MLAGNRIGLFKIRQRARDLEQAMRRAQRQDQSLAGRFKPFFIGCG